MLTLVLLITALSPGDAVVEKDGWLVEKLVRSEAIGEGVPVELHNPYGDIRARSNVNQVVELSAMVQTKKGDAHKLDFEVEKHEDRLIVRVVYPGDESETIKGKGKRRADVTIYVPNRSPFLARTHKGMIRAKGMKSDVDFETFSGKIYVRTDGRVRTHSHQGNAQIVLMKAEWGETPVLSSILGEIQVELPRDADVKVKAETMGLISTDFSLDIKRNGELKTAIAQLGKGTYNLDINSKQGDIKILMGKWDVDKH